MSNPSFICSGQGLVELLRDKKEIVGLEIGTDVGDTANYFLNELPQLTLHSIDPYINYIDWNGTNLNNRDTVYHGMMNRLSKFGNRFVQHRKTSDDAVSVFANIKFDFIFIDGLHTYEQCLKDCENYYPLLKRGKLFAGHDYGVISGVKRAVDEFAGRYSKQILTTYHDVWYWYK